MKLFIFTVIFSVFSSAEMGLPPVDLRAGQFVEGNLFSVKYVPGDKAVSFFIVGSKKAGLKFAPKQTVLEVNGKSYSLKQDSSGKAYVYSSSLESEAVLKLEKEDGNTEEFRLKIP